MPINCVYAGGIASFNSENVNQSIPYARGAFSTLFGFIPNLNRSSRLALLAVVTNSGISEWSHFAGASSGKFVSKNLCRCVRNPNIEPQSITGASSSFLAPATFSMQYGFPIFRQSSRTAGISFSWLHLLASGVRWLYAWQGGLACIASNSCPCVAKYSRASPCTNWKG